MATMMLAMLGSPLATLGMNPRQDLDQPRWKYLGS